jgi:hypothetical protein
VKNTRKLELIQRNIRAVKCIVISLATIGLNMKLNRMNKKGRAGCTCISTHIHTHEYLHINYTIVVYS